MPTASPPRPVAVLDHAIAWTHGCLQLARNSPLTAATPCHEWDLGQLLRHMDDSLVALAEAAELGRVGVAGWPTPLDTAQSIDHLVERACRTREAWHRRVTSAPISVRDLRLGRDTMALVGALEIAVHGWDIARASGHAAQMPEDLARSLHEVARAVVTPSERGRRFGPAVPVPSSAPASTRLLAHLGRDDG